MKTTNRKQDKEVVRYDLYERNLITGRIHQIREERKSIKLEKLRKCWNFVVMQIPNYRVITQIRGN